MPRKQRFKPSRKPQSTQAAVSNQTLDDRKEIQPDDRLEQQAPVGEQPARDIESEQG